MRRSRPVAALVAFAAHAAVTLMALLWLHGAAGAHASLIASAPADGATVAAPPAILSLTFNEPVSPLSLTLTAPDGSRTALDRFTLDGSTLRIGAPAELSAGTHIFSWRVTSQDGHPVGGSVLFSIGEASAAPPAGEDATDPAVRAGLLAGRTALYIGLFLGAGGAFARAWWLGGQRHGSCAILAATATGLLGVLASTGFQGLDVLGAGPAALVDPHTWSAAMATSFGGTAIAAAMALGAALLCLVAGGVGARLLSLAALLLAGGALALSGHASTAEPQWLMRPAVFLHAGAIALWAGALMPLGLAIRRGGPDALPALRRFSAAIPVIVAVLIVSGATLAAVQVERPAALMETAYGRVLLVKLGLLAGLFLLAAVNRWRLTAPAQRGDHTATRRLVRSIAAEALIVLVILAVVSAWRFTPPPRALAMADAGPAVVHVHGPDATAAVTIAPGRAGPVDITLAVMTAASAPLDAREVTLELTPAAAGIEPIRRAASMSGDGRWRVQGLVLPLAGAWQLRVDILIDDFEMARLEGEIMLRP